MEEAPGRAGDLNGGPGHGRNNARGETPKYITRIARNPFVYIILQLRQKMNVNIFLEILINNYRIARVFSYEYILTNISVFDIRCGLIFG